MSSNNIYAAGGNINLSNITGNLDVQQSKNVEINNSTIDLSNITTQTISGTLNASTVNIDGTFELTGTYNRYVYEFGGGEGGTFMKDGIGIAFNLDDNNDLLLKKYEDGDDVETADTVYKIDYLDKSLSLEGNLNISGNVGIGTNDPTALLTFPPRSIISGSATRVLIEMPSVRHDSNFKIYNNDTDGEAKLTLAYYNPNFTHVMTWQHSGNIGIGTWTPRYPLEVQGRKAVEYFDSYTHKGNWYGAGQYHPVSIATDRIGLNYVIWYSDRRIKKDFELVNDDKALKQVNNLQSYEYNYIDPDRMTEQKVIGFIAQEVKDVIPNAVSIDKNFIPDEMRIIENLQWSQFTDATGNNKFKLEINDIDFSGNFTGQCKFYVSNDSKGKNEICKIIMIEDDKKSFIFDERWITVFFYGKEVTDFHNVDKAQIFSLHHSAIQELSRKHDAVVEENTQLKADIMKQFYWFETQHRCFINDIDYNNYENYIGLIASANNNQYRQMSKGIYHKIMINEALPILSVCKTKKDKSVFGVISYKEDERVDIIGNFGTPYDKETGDNRSYVNSVGEGCIWVISENGNIKSGDYITSSSVPGYGMLQISDIMYNYTVAKSTMDCNFTKSKIPKKIAKQTTKNIKKIRKEKVTKQKEYVIYDEEINRYVKKYDTIETEEEIIVEHDLYDDKGNIIGKHKGPDYIEYEIYENELDEYGNIILIDQTDENGNIIYEDYCETRYVDNNGKIISENEYNTKKSNGESVYMACFVGCTYHCG